MIEARLFDESRRSPFRRFAKGATEIAFTHADPCCERSYREVCIGVFNDPCDQVFQPVRRIRLSREARTEL